MGRAACCSRAPRSLCLPAALLAGVAVAYFARLIILLVLGFIGDAWTPLSTLIWVLTFAALGWLVVLVTGRVADAVNAARYAEAGEHRQPPRSHRPAPGEPGPAGVALHLRRRLSRHSAHSGHRQPRRRRLGDRPGRQADAGERHRRAGRCSPTSRCASAISAVSAARRRPWRRSACADQAAQAGRHRHQHAQLRLLPARARSTTAGGGAGCIRRPSGFATRRRKSSFGR